MLSSMPLKALVAWLSTVIESRTPTGEASTNINIMTWTCQHICARLKVFPTAKDSGNLWTIIATPRLNKALRSFSRPSASPSKIYIDSTAWVDRAKAST